MTIGESDNKELTNIKTEKLLSKNILSKVQTLAHASKELRKEYKTLLKATNKVAKLIKKKEADNADELAKMHELQKPTPQSTGDLKTIAKRLKTEERAESQTSKEEAFILQDMLNQLYKTYAHGQSILKEGKIIYDLIQTMYTKDLADYQLEYADINKA
ncbi:hypothetical protein GF367_01705 [Candidatus Woesearchaeota archaeon]|nr:hypothetical protein [Candidatus Woesearchaeota archaeon]